MVYMINTHMPCRGLTMPHMHTHVHVYTHTHACMHIHTYTYTHVYTDKVSVCFLTTGTLVN